MIISDKNPYIFNIQRFCVHDGPGIRTIVFFKGCPLRCTWCSNPESQEKTREILHLERLCVRCGICEACCPNKAISVSKDKYVIEREKCTFCGECIRACPNNAIEISGNSFSISDLISLSLNDKLFWQQSNGGITISGGEPLLHVKFLLNYLKQLKQYGISTAIETSGFTDFKNIRSITDYTDLFIYDIKHLDNNSHKLGTGVSNKVIIENCKRLLEMKKPMLLRVPIIPSFNFYDDFFRSLAHFISDLMIRKVDLLPFHRLGANKYESLGRRYLFQELPPLSEREILPFARHLRNIKDCTILINGVGIDQL